MKKFNFLLSPQSFPYLLLIFLFVFSGCEKEPVAEIEDPILNFEAKAHPDKLNEFYGPAEQLGLGVARSMVRMNRDGTPNAIGVRISEKVLNRLPDNPAILTLQLPNKAEGLPFDHIDLDWNPLGHEPQGLFTVPHFDVHFYMVSEDYKMSITDLEKAANYPAPEFIPAGYLPPPDFLPVQLVPYMGVHWTKEDEAPPFTQTFIYGSYDGSFIFMEPMVTLEYLVNDADGTSFPIAQPQEYPLEGYFYPTSYSMNYDAKRKDYVIELYNMVWRE